MAQLSFKTIFQKYGKKLTQWLEDNITNSGRDWQPFTPPKVTTWGVGKGGGVYDTGKTHNRMDLTGKTKKTAFKFKAEDSKLTLYVQETERNRKIFGENNIGGDIPIKPTHVQRVAIFPMAQTENSFEQKAQPIIELKSEFKTFTESYFQNLVNTQLNQKIKI